MNLDNTFESTLQSIGVKTSDEKVVEAAKKVGMDIADNKKEQEAHRLIQIGADDRQIAVNTSLIPPKYKDAVFDTEKIKNNLRQQYLKSNKLYRIYKFSDYLGVCNGILTCVRAGMLPNRSYLIGAPNGFGKTSFVNECLITLKRNGFRVAPYITLLELAEIKAETEKRLMEPFGYVKISEQDAEKLQLERERFTYINPYTNKGVVKSPQIVTGYYSYSEYINADCLFVAITDTFNKAIESFTLKHLLCTRGMKGLPTIVTIGESLEPYIVDNKLKELVWDEILTFGEEDICFDRLYHVSCYKMKNVGLNRNEDIESDTGIVS